MNMKITHRPAVQSTQAPVETAPVQNQAPVSTTPDTSPADGFGTTSQSADRPAARREGGASLPLHGATLQAQLDHVGKSELALATQAGAAAAAVFAQGDLALHGADIDTLFSAWLQERLRESARKGPPTVESRLKEIEHLLAAGLVGPGSHAELVLEKAGLISLHSKMQKLQERTDQIDRVGHRAGSPEGRAALHVERQALGALAGGYGRLQEEIAVREKALAAGQGDENTRAELTVMRALQGGIAGLDAARAGLDGSANVERNALMALKQVLESLAR